MTTSELQPTVEISDKALHLIAGYSALAGVMPLLPVPFIDDMIIDHIHRRLYQKLATQHEFYLSVDDAKRLTSRKSSLLGGAIRSVVIWPVKKILRKLFYILAIKSCAEVAASVFHKGWLMARALEQEYVPRHSLATGDRDTVMKLRDGIESSYDSVDLKMTEQVMRTAFSIGKTALAPLIATIPNLLSKNTDDAIDDAEEQTAPITTRIEQEIRTHWHLAPALDRALRKELDV